MVRYRYEKQIASLLLQNQEVVIPKVGKLVVSTTPARISKEEQRIIPPGQELSFINNLTDDKGILAQTIARYFDLEYSIAKNLVQHECETVFKHLQAGRTILFPGLGEVYLNENQEISFKKCPTEDSLVEREIGLTEVQLPAGVIDLKAKKKVKIAGAKSRNWAKIAASLALPAVIGAGFWFQQDINNGMQLAKFGDWGKEQATYKARRYNPTEIKNTEEAIAVKNFKYSGKGFKVLSLNELKLPVRLPEEKVEINYRYQLIGGCFKDLGNANKAVENFTNQGFEAFISEFKHGLYRVCIGKFETKAELKKEIKRAKQELGVNPWFVKA
ncbi:HU domain-containing protein [Luteibaculum oceani]|uniref:SPOR domain-containing protein n=1 Tax=Luteibaculum oceani TaxID=1294296 RepID=A0A5C6V171_9FLAO|nr:SPOR domain-containing protein [Luteibaculum oceani]TXC78949.1 SPOR domain-containing protein [Luteibaculum oceani]